MKFLIVIDCQNDFIDGVLGTPEAQAVVPNIVKTINEFDKDVFEFHKGKVICTMDTHYAEYLNTAEGKKLPIPHCVYHTQGWNINKEVDTALSYRNVSRITKQTFGSSQLANTIIHLSAEHCNWRMNEISIVGFCTDICVITNALILKTAFPETPIRVLESCCAGTTPEKHRAALDVMRSCQIDIV